MKKENELSLQQFIDRALAEGDYDIATDLFAQELANRSRAIRRMRYRRSLAAQAMYQGPSLPRDMDCADKRSISFGGH